MTMYRAVIQELDNGELSRIYDILVGNTHVDIDMGQEWPIIQYVIDEYWGFDVLDSGDHGVIYNFTIDGVKPNWQVEELGKCFRLRFTNEPEIAKKLLESLWRREIKFEASGVAHLHPEPSMQEAFGQHLGVLLSCVTRWNGASTAALDQASQINVLQAGSSLASLTENQWALIKVCG